MTVARGTSAGAYDAWGAPCSATSAEALAHWAGTVESVLGHRADAPQKLERVLASDPEFPLGLCLQGFGCLFKGRRELRPRALEAARRARASTLARGGCEREERLSDALEAWATDDPETTLAHLEAVLAAHPIDPWVIKLQHGLLFILGRQEELRAATQRVVGAWRPTERAAGYVLGCHAFALEETMAFDEAERVARQAIELQPDDAWGIHALAHVMEMQDRTDEGVACLESHETGYAECAVFRGHVYWHHALFLLALERYDEALGLYDREVHRGWAGDYRDMSNCVSLLFQLEEAGVDVGDRWDELVSIAREFGVDHGSAFADVHYALALARGGACEALLTSLKAHAATGTQAEVVQRLGLPLCQAIHELYSGSADRAAEALSAHREEIVGIGGSNAQRDLFEVMLVDAALRAGRKDIARRELDRRLSTRPQNRWAQRRLQALSA